MKSTLEILPTTFNPNAEASFECHASINWELLGQLTGYNPKQPFYMSYEQPIMIQSRWHKKLRIRKKWLKRYGMKPDTILVEIPIVNGKYDTRDGNFSFNTNKINYKLRPDQLRRDIKIKM